MAKSRSREDYSLIIAIIAGLIQPASARRYWPSLGAGAGFPSVSPLGARSLWQLAINLTIDLTSPLHVDQ